MAGKETIDIEALLHRAYGQHRVDKVTPQGVLGLGRRGPGGSLVGAMQAVALGTIVDNSGVAARMIGLQTMMAATPDDMLVVHDHVLALADWLIEEARSGEPAVWRRTDIAARGWRVEEAADGLWLVRPGEARGGGDAMSALTDPYLLALVVEHARAGTRPDDLGVSERARRRRGRPGAAARAERGDVMLARAIYATWHAALGVLAADLDGVLTMHRVTGPAAVADPWNRPALPDLRGGEAEAALPAG